MVDRIDRPIVPQTHANEVEHRKMLAVRANAAMPKDGTEGMAAPLKVKQYAVADMPDATLFPGAIVHDNDDNVPSYSNGSAWTPLATGANVTALQAEIDAAEADIATLQTDLNAAEANISTLQTSVSTLQTDVAALEAFFTSGTWTPTIAFGGSSTGVTYGTRVGSYIKINKLVLLTMHIVLTSNGSATGAATITGFSTTPGTAATVTGQVWVGTLAPGTGNTAASFDHAPHCQLASAGTSISLLRGDSAGNVLDQDDILDTSTLSLNLMYQAA